MCRCGVGRRLVLRARRATLAAPAALAADECRRARGPQRLARRELHLGFGDHDRGLALVVHGDDAVLRGRLGLDRDRPMQRDRLRPVDEQREVERTDLTHRALARRGAARAGHDGERRIHDLIDPRAVLGGERELVLAGTDADCVQQRVLRVPRDGAHVTDGADGIRIERHVEVPLIVLRSVRGPHHARFGTNGSSWRAPPRSRMAR